MTLPVADFVVAPVPRFNGPPRDWLQRPKIIPPGGGPLVPYTRATTLAGTLEDRFRLGLWEQRMVARGLAERADLLLAVAAHQDDDKRLNELVGAAREAAAASSGATIGTALHRIVEQVDRGQDISVPKDYMADIEAYRRTMVGYRMHAIEQFLVNDTLKVGGTTDRILENEAHPGFCYIADVKTGSLYGSLKMCMQLAIYAHSEAYDPATGERHPIDVSQRWGIIIHLPARKGECVLYWADLRRGWDAVQTAVTVRDLRKEDNLLMPVGLRPAVAVVQ